MRDMTFSEIISLVLAVGAIITPIFFGFILYKLSQVFVTKTDFNQFKVDQEKNFNEFKAEQDVKHDDNKTSLRDIQNDIKMIFIKGKFEP